MPEPKTTSDLKLKIFDNYESVSRAAAELFVVRSNEAVNKSGRFSVALSGGSTPRRLYELLTTDEYSSRIPWDKVHVFWGDERCVPTSSPESNSGEAFRTLLDHVPIPEAQIHPIDGTLPPAQAAIEYEKVIRDFFESGPTRFDLVFLGLGTNGHTASLFPGTPVVKESTRLVSEVFVEEIKGHRITLTAQLINQARALAFLVSGRSKADVLHEVLEGSYDPDRLPAQLMRSAAGEVLWFVDRAAAAKLAE